MELLSASLLMTVCHHSRVFALGGFLNQSQLRFQSQLSNCTLVFAPLKIFPTKSPKGIFTPAYIAKGNYWRQMQADLAESLRLSKLNRTTESVILFHCCLP